MARITITGTVTRVFWENKGFEVTEFFKTKNGEQAKRSYSVFFEAPQHISENAYGTFTGLLSYAIRDWVDKEGQPVISKVTGKQGQSVDIKVNGAEFKPDTSGRPATEPEPVSNDVNNYVQSAAAILDVNTPF